MTHSFNHNIDHIDPNNVHTLYDLAEIINSSEEYYPYNIVTDIIKRNGWDDRQIEPWEICVDPKTGKRLLLDDDVLAFVI